MKKSIISHITKFSSLMFIFIAVSLVVILTYSFYKSYANNLKVLEDKLIENYTSTIKKRNYNIKLVYTSNYQVALDNMKNEIKNRVYLGYSLLQNIYYNNINRKKIEEIKREALRVLSLIRFDNGKGFYNIFNLQGHRINSQFNWIFPDKEKFIRILNEIKKGNNGFFTIEVEDARSSKKYKKIIYGIYFEQFDWIILTGFLQDDLIKQANEIFLMQLKRMKFPKFIGVVVVDDKNKVVFSPADAPKVFMDKLRNIGKSGIFELNASGLHYVVMKTRVPHNNWKIITYFVKENVAYDIQGVKYRFVNFFILQIVVIIFFVLTVFIVFVFYLKKFNVKLRNQLNYFIDHIKKLPYQYKKIDTEKLQFLELEEIGHSANKMVDTIKKLNESLEHERNFLDTILTNLPYGIGVVDENLVIEYANDHALRMMKFDKGIIGKKLYDLLPKNFPKKHFIFIQFIEEVKRRKSELIIDKIRLIRGDGVTIYAHMAIAPIFGSEKSKIDKYVILFYDITDELKIRQQLTTLKRAVENAPVSVVITDTRCRISYVNAYFENLTGYTLDEAKGKTPRIISTKYNHKFYDEIKRTLFSGNSWKGEFLNKKKNGETYWEQALISPVFDDNGKIVNFVAVKEDITERKKFISELQKAKEKAEIASKAKSQFLANMSHEIRTPMNAIIGFIDLLLQTEMTDIQKKYLELISESTNNLLRILNDILDISKFESKGISFEDQPFNLKKVITACSNIFSGKVSEKNLDFEINIDENIPDYLIGDDVRIGQVLNNLLNNAVKFTQEGYIRLDAKLVDMEDDKAVIKICVEDSGIGIPEEKHEMIFDAFTQADNSVTRKFGGTGLGLAIAKKIVEKYEGKIWIESKPDKGAKFCFIIKLKVADKVVEFDTADERKNLDFSGTDYRILVAEDHYTNQILMKELFKSMGLYVKIVNNGVEALQELAENYYDIVFMDWHMPEMDGVETLEILRKLERGEDIDCDKVEKSVLDKLKGKKFVIVALTAAGMKEEKDILIAKGFDDYLFKPIQKKFLNEVLKKYLKNFSEKINGKKTLEPNRDYLMNLVGNDEEVVNRLLSSFKETFKNSINELKVAVEKQDYENIRKIAHTLKGAAGNLGFKEILEICREIERAVKEKSIEEIITLVNILSDIEIK